jgi:hypothetical protein
MKNYHNTRLSRRSVKYIQIIQGGQDLTTQAGLIPVVKFLKIHGFASKIEQTRNKLTPDAFGLRLIDKVAVKGKEDPVLIHEVLDAEVPEERDGKLVTLETFCTGWELYQNQQFEKAQAQFQNCLEQTPKDSVAELYVERCKTLLSSGWDPETWEGIIRMDTK